MRIKEVKPNQKVRNKKTNKEYVVIGTSHPFNSFMARRMVALVGVNHLVKASELELIEEEQSND